MPALLNLSSTVRVGSLRLMVAKPKGCQPGGDMLNAWERWVFYYDLALKPFPDIAPDYPLEPLLEALRQRRAEGLCFDRIENERKVIRLRDIQLFPQPGIRAAALLINYADPDVPDAVYENLNTGELREARKREDEGGSYSTHILVSLDAEPNGQAYLCLVEDVPGLGRSKITPFLTRQFKAIAEAAPGLFTFEDPNRNQRAYRPIAEMNGHASQTLRDDLDGGVLKGFELIQRRRAPVEYDELGFTQERVKSIQLTIRQDLGQLTRDVAMRVVNSVTRKARADGYDSVKVRFKKMEGRQRSILVGTVWEDAGDALYTRCEMVDGFIIGLKQSEARIRTDLIGKMISIMRGIPVPHGLLEGGHQEDVHDAHGA